MITIFRHDTPVMLKKKGDLTQLRTFMNKIYPSELVDQRTKEIGADDDEADGAPSPGYVECFTNPRYRRASWIGCGISVF